MGTKKGVKSRFDPLSKERYADIFFFRIRLLEDEVLIFFDPEVLFIDDLIMIINYSKHRNEYNYTDELLKVYIALRKV